MCDHVPGVSPEAYAKPRSTRTSCHHHNTGGKEKKLETMRSEGKKSKGDIHMCLFRCLESLLQTFIEHACFNYYAFIQTIGISCRSGMI